MPQQLPAATPEYPPPGAVGFQDPQHRHTPPAPRRAATPAEMQGSFDGLRLRRRRRGWRPPLPPAAGTSPGGVAGAASGGGESAP